MKYHAVDLKIRNRVFVLYLYSMPWKFNYKFYFHFWRWYGFRIELLNIIFMFEIPYFQDHWNISIPKGYW